MVSDFLFMKAEIVYIINHENAGNHEYPSDILYDTSSMYQKRYSCIAHKPSKICHMIY